MSDDLKGILPPTTEAFETDAYEVSEAMIEFGGTFVRGLGGLIQTGDSDNKRRLFAAFPEYVARYREIAKDKKGSR